jgi:hypothetical protein
MGAIERYLRNVAWVFAIFLAVLCWAPALAARPTAPALEQGLFEDCAPSDGNARCLSRLRSMSASGFTLVINYSQFYGSAADQMEYARTASSLGMRVIWNFSEPAFWDGTDLRTHFGDLGATCDCSDNPSFLKYLVGLLKDVPGTWGYYVGDEVAAKNHRRLRAFSDALARLDPSHPRMLVAIGDPSLAITRANLAPFADVAEIIGADYYPVGPGISVEAVGKVARNVRSVARAAGRRSMMVLQAFGWEDYPDQTSICSPFPRCARYPTQSEMRRMRDLSLAAAHPSLIMWYSFFDIARSNNPARHWRDLIKAAGTAP